MAKGSDLQETLLVDNENPKFDDFEPIGFSDELPQSQLSEWQINSFSHYIPQLDRFDESQEKNPPAIFILAPPRSGTSLLRLMLAGHPELFAVNELKLLGLSLIHI